MSGVTVPSDADRIWARAQMRVPDAYPPMVIPYPAGFTGPSQSWTPPTILYRGRDGRFYSTVTARDLQPRGGIQLFVSKQGNDSDDGLTWETAKLTIAGAIASTAYTTSPTTPATILIRPGRYAGLGGSTTLLRDTALIGIDGRPELSGATYGDAVTWTAEPGVGAGVYSTPYVAANGFNMVVFDELDIDANGNPTALTEGATLVVHVGTTPRRYIIEGNKLYLHLYNNRQPDVGIAFASTTAEANAITAASDGKKFYAENISFRYGLHAFHASGNTGDVILYRCEALGGANKGFENAKLHPTMAWMEECTARRNGQDGFSLNLSARALEINCVCTYNGWLGTQFLVTSNNGSTCHDSSRVVRLNGLYAYNQDRNIHDVTSSRSFNLGVMAAWTQTSIVKPGTTTAYDGSNFVCSHDLDVAVTCRMWLLDCYGAEGSIGNYNVYHSGIMYRSNCAPGVDTSGTSGAFDIF